jgi:tetratricopeptide (TPR) repeat protein
MRAGRSSNYDRGVRIPVLAALLTAMPLLAADIALVQRGFDHFYNLEYPEAVALFEQAIGKDPARPELHNHLAQTLVFQEMFRNGALESELVNGNNSFLRRPKLNPSAETERRFLGEIDKSLALCETLLKKNPKDTSALYAMGIAYGLRSDYFWVVKKSWRDSLKDATDARKAHNRVVELEPQNMDARLVQGLHDYIVGSLPWHYRLLGFLVGFRGDKERGVRTVREVAGKGNDNRVDAQILLCALYRRENQTRLAVPIVQELIGRFPRNYLLRLELAQMYSMAGDGAKGLEALRELARLKTAGAPGLDRVPWEKIYYQEGSIQFWYNDLPASLENLKRVAAAADEIDLNTGVLAFLRMGQIYDLTRQREQALESYRKAVAYAPQSEAAQESRKYLTTPYRRM